MKIIEITRDRSLPGWRAVMETFNSMEQRLMVTLRRVDLSGAWEVESIDDVPSPPDRRVRPDTMAHTVLEMARSEAESDLAGDPPQV